MEGGSHGMTAAESNAINALTGELASNTQAILGLAGDVREIRDSQALMRGDILALQLAQARQNGVVTLAKWLVGLCVTLGLGIAGLFGMGHRP